MHRTPDGSLIIIGGREDQDRELAILREVAARAKRGDRRLALVVVAAQPAELAAGYGALFAALGAAPEIVGIQSREQAFDQQLAAAIDQASAAFVAGDDPQRIASQLGGSPLAQALGGLYARGGTLAGTSAGAAALAGAMLVGGDESLAIAALELAPGLGLLNDVLIEPHCAERGRIGRLLGAAARHPRHLGLGLDEDTAIIVEGGRRFRVIGAGAVYVVDGSTITYSSLSEQHPGGIPSMYDVRMHILGDGDEFDLIERQPILPEDAQREA